MSPSYEYSHQNKSVDTSRFAMIPRPQVPRSTFVTAMTHKTTFIASVLVPVFLEEVLPGDSWTVRATMFARLSTMLFPMMDNIHLDTFWFFTPNRLVWDNWNRFMGEQINPGDSVDFLIPQKAISVSTTGSLSDYFGIPINPQLDPGEQVEISALPFRMYNLIWNEWFRAEDLQNSITVDRSDGPDLVTYFVQRRGKRHDYFTSALPWPIKGGVDVALPLSGSAAVRGIGFANGTAYGAGAQGVQETGGTSRVYSGVRAAAVDNALMLESVNMFGGLAYPDIYADLSTATSATVNAIRQAIAIQHYLEANARGGTRYTEILRARFGVASPDARLQRPEYLGGNSTPIHVTPIAQTAPSAGGSGPLASLGATASVVHPSGFSQSFVEHGYIMCLVNARADITYQQGIRRHWRRRTVYDFYAPEFAHLGEQAIRRQEIYATGNDANDEAVFGYTPRWEEYRHLPSQISGRFRSAATGTLDAWHLSQNFATAPLLGTNFIEDQTVNTLNRVTAIDEATFPTQQFLFDSRFDVRMTRPMPTYSTPGLDRF